MMDALDRPAWQDRARCRTEHPDLYVTDNLPDSNARALFAAKLCHGCPVKRDCAYDAICYDTSGVVRGGYAFPNDRTYAHRLRRRIARELGVAVPEIVAWFPDEENSVLQLSRASEVAA